METYQDEINILLNQKKIVENNPIEVVWIMFEDFDGCDKEFILDTIQDDIKEIEGKQEQFQIEEYYPEKYYHYLDPNAVHAPSKMLNQLMFG